MWHDMNKFGFKPEPVGDNHNVDTITTTLDKSIAVGLLPAVGTVAAPIEHRGFRRTVTQIKCLAALRLLRDQWDNLAAVAENVPLYLTFPYCEIVAEQLFAKSRSIIVVQIFSHDDDSLIALWPFVIERRGVWRVALHLSCGTHEEYCLPLMRKGFNCQTVMNAAVAAAVDLPADVLELHYVEESSCLDLALVGKIGPRFLPSRLGRWGASSIALRNFVTIDEYYRSVLSSGLRRNLKRQMKALQAQGKIEVGWCASVEDTHSVLQWIFIKKREWAKARGIVTPWLYANDVVDHHVRLAQSVDLTTTPLVAFIKCDGVPVAASLSWIGDDIHEWCITAYDDVYHRYGVGILLLEFLVNWSHARRLDFDFRFFETDYKDRWATQHTTQRMRYVFLNRFGRAHEIHMFMVASIASLRHRGRRIIRRFF